jgi:hypothetical protein
VPTTQQHTKLNGAGLGLYGGGSVGGGSSNVYEVTSRAGAVGDMNSSNSNNHRHSSLNGHYYPSNNGIAGGPGLLSQGPLPQTNIAA